MRNIRILFFVLLCSSLLPVVAFTQVKQEVTNIGNDNELTIRGPSYTGLINISLTGSYQFETIYLADEINITADGELTAIEFYVSEGLSASLLGNTQFYLKTTNQASLSDGNISNPGDEGYTQVDGSFSLLGLSLDDGDIIRFELDEGFPIDEGDNLAIHTRGGSVLGLSAGVNFYATSTDSDNLTKASTQGLLGWDPMEVTDLRPNARLEFETQFEVSAGNSVITAQRPQILADGSSTTLVTLQVRTSSGENVNSGGENVNFSTNSGSISSANDNGDGTYTAVLTSSNSPGTATVTATLNGSSVGDDTEVEFVESLALMYCTDLDAEDIQIGNITSATTPRGPLFSNTASLTLGTYQFETIYLQNELNLDGQGFLNTIEFFVDGDINIDALGNVGVYIKETNNNSLSDGNVSLDGYTFVGGNAALVNVTVSGQRRLRVEFETPFFYSNDNNLAIHVRHSILADVNVGGEFHYTTANENLTKVSQDFIGLLGITVGLTSPETTSQRPDINFEFDLLTSASLSESSLTANPTERVADGSSASVITAMIRKADGSVCILESGAPDFFSTLGSFGSISDEGEGEYTVPLTSTTPGTAVVSAEIDGEELNDKPNVEFTAEVLPPSSDFTTINASPTEIAADGSSTSQITLTLRDENDDPVTTGGFDMNLSTTAGTLSGITDNGDGTYTATLTSSTTEETATITGTLEGENIDDTAQVAFTALSPSPDFTTITASPGNILADGSSTSEITVTLRDVNDNPVSTGGFDVALSTTAGTLSGVTDNGDGTYTATLTSSNTEETAVISGTLEGEDIDDTAEVHFVSDIMEPSPEHIQITVNPGELPADGESQATVTVTLYDENNDPITDGGFCELLDLSTTAGSLGSITDNGDGTCTLPLTADDEPGMAEITGSIDGESIDDTAEIEFTALPPSPEFTTINANPNNILADGSSTSEITVNLRDKNDNPVTTGGFDVNLSTSAGTLGNLIDNGDGTYTAILTSSTNEETATISGTLEGEDIDDTAKVNFVEEVLEPSPEHTQITVNPDELPADGESEATVTITLFDENNDPISEGGYCELVVISTTAGTLGEITDNGDGTCTLTLTADIEPGKAEITGTIDGEDIDDTADINFTALPPSPDFTTITASPKKILADGSSTSEITVRLRDELNNPVTKGGFDVSLSTTAGSLSSVADNGDGTYSAILTSTSSQDIAEISGTLEGEDIDDTTEVEFVEQILPPSSEFTTITAAPTTILADGESTSAITVTLRDENNELVGQGGYNVTLSTSNGTLSSVTDNGDGTFTAILTAPNMVGMATITGTVEGETIDDTATVEFVSELLPPSADNTTIEAEPVEIPADGTSSSTITVTLRNANNEPVGSGGYDVELTTTAGTLSNITDNGDGTYTATLTSTNSPETATITGTLEGEDINDSATIEFVIDESEPDPDFITIQASPTEIPADGVSTSTITVTLFNGNDEPITEGGYCSSVGLSTTIGTLSDITDEADGNCTATLTASLEAGEAVITGTYNGESIQKNVIVTFLSLDMFQCKVETVFPNPFLDNATFRVTSPRAGRITLDIYDILGKQVATVVNEDVTAGQHDFNMNGSHLSSGVYIYRYECPCKCQSDTGQVTHVGRN